MFRINKFSYLMENFYPDREKIYAKITINEIDKLTILHTDFNKKIYSSN